MGSYDTSAGITALIAIGVLALITCWVFGSRGQRCGRLVDASDSRELGLLTVIVSGVPRAQALQHPAMLGESDIRSSMSRRQGGTMDVLVFHADADSARILLGQL